jgi:thiosulfate reductase cytochrome b subunit
MTHQKAYAGTRGPPPGKTVRRLVAWLLFVMTVLVLLTGFGITEPGIIGPLTGGLLGKSIAERAHIYLWGPFIILLVLHMSLSLFPGRWWRTG